MSILGFMIRYTVIKVSQITKIEDGPIREKTFSLGRMLTHGRQALDRTSGDARSDRASKPPLFRKGTAGLKSTQTYRQKITKFSPQPSRIK